MAEMALHCQYGNHTWTRPAQRGRPPLNCPDHVEAAKASAPVKELTRDYDTLTLPELRTALREHGLQPGRMNKADMVKTLKVRDRLAKAKITRAANKAAAQKAVAQPARKAAVGRSKAGAASPTQKGVTPASRAASPVAARLPRSRAVSKSDAEGVTTPKTELELFVEARDAADKIRAGKESAAKERIDNLERMLRGQGTHISQHQAADR